MRISRVLALGTVTGLGTLTVALVCADRLAHPAIAATPAPAIARAAPVLPEPVTTGTVTQGPVRQGPVTSEPPRGRMVSGFDTERLNALMRGETVQSAQRKR